MEAKCINCGKTFNAERKSAKFDNDTCRQEYHRKNKEILSEIKVDVKEIKKEPELSPEEKKSIFSFGVPNWKRNGFPTQEKAMIYSIALVMKKVPGAGITWKGRYWTKEDFDKKLLDSVEELI